MNDEIDYQTEVLGTVYAVVNNPKLRLTTVLVTSRAFTEWHVAVIDDLTPEAKADWKIVGGYLHDLLYITSVAELGL